jgi:hypothetical protein
MEQSDRCHTPVRPSPTLNGDVINAKLLFTDFARAKPKLETPFSRNDLTDVIEQEVSISNRSQRYLHHILALQVFESIVVGTWSPAVRKSRNHSDLHLRAPRHAMHDVPDTEANHFAAWYLRGALDQFGVADVLHSAQCSHGGCLPSWFCQVDSTLDYGDLPNQRF